MSKPIDLAAVAARIAALDGWRIGIRSESGATFSNSDSHLTIKVGHDGRVVPLYFPYDLMPLLPVLQIVKEAQG